MKLKDYILSLERGEVKKLAQQLGVSSSYLSQMSSGRVPVPIARCIDIENATSGLVTRKELRPLDWNKIWPDINFSK
ncbi:transcriptional regulator [Providencia rettgeri]